MRSFTVEGIVIKRRNYGEADRLVTVFTKYHGKLLVKASGVRKITSRRSAHIELLNYSSLTLHQSHSMPIVTEAQVMNNFSLIKDDLTKVGLAYHICELVDGLCPEGVEHREVFELLHKTLRELSGSYLVFPLVHPHPNPPPSRGREYEIVPSPLRGEGQDEGERLGDSDSITTIIHGFEVELLSLLGFWHGQPEMAKRLDTQNFIENIIERKLKSRKIFSKLQ